MAFPSLRTAQFRLSVGPLPKAREIGSFPELPLSSPQHTVRGFVEKHQHLSGTEPLRTMTY